MVKSFWTHAFLPVIFTLQQMREIDLSAASPDVLPFLGE